MISQSGAICLVDDKMVLVTNSGRTRWVIPKGKLEQRDKSLGERAEQEAWEEAGVRGRLHPECLGHFLYRKNGGIYCVSVFMMTQCDLADRWPESTLRERVLRSPKEAVDMVDEEGLKKIIEQIRINDPSGESSNSLG